MTAYLAAQGKGVANAQVPMFEYRESSVTISQSGNYDMKYESMTKLLSAIKTLVDDKDCASSDLDRLYQQSCIAVVEKKQKEIKDSYIMNDIISHSKLTRGFWWMLHCGKIGASRSQVLKDWLKSLNK